MTLQALNKSRSFYRCLPASVLCALSMTAFNSEPAAQETAVSRNEDGQQSGAIRPRLVYDGRLTVTYSGYDIKLYRGITEGESINTEIARNTPYFHEPLIHFRKSPDGGLKHTIADGGGLTLYVAMNILEHQTLEYVKAYLQDNKGVSKENLPLDANIQPLSARGWFQSSANEDIRSKIGDVMMSSRTGQDILIHFPMPTREAAASFLSRLNANEEQLTFNYSLQGDAIEVCTVDASSETMTNHHRFQELTGDASEDGRYVSRDQIADLMSQISRHVSISSHCRTEAIEKELRNRALERLADKVESAFTIDQLDALTNIVEDDIRADIDNASNTIQSEEERKQIQNLSQQVRSGAITFGAFVKGIVEAIPFAAEATVERSHASGEAYQFMWDRLSRVHDQLEWTGTRYRPKQIDVYRREQLRNALNTSIHFRHETPVFARDIRTIPIPKANWIPVSKERPSSNTELEVLSERLHKTQKMIETLMARVDNRAKESRSQLKSDKESARESRRRLDNAVSDMRETRKMFSNSVKEFRFSLRYKQPVPTVRCADDCVYYKYIATNLRIADYPVVAISGWDAGWRNDTKFRRCIVTGISPRPDRRKKNSSGKWVVDPNANWNINVIVNPHHSKTSCTGLIVTVTLLAFEDVVAERRYRYRW